MTTFLAFLEVAICYLHAGAIYHHQVEDMVALKRPTNFEWYDSLFLVFAPISIPGAIAYLTIIYFLDKNKFND